MAYTPDPKCLAAATAAAGQNLTQQEVLDAFQRVADYRDQLRGIGGGVGMEARMRRFAAEQAEKTRIMAALARRNAARNAIIHDKIQTQIGTMVTAGIKPRNALLGLLEGIQNGVRNARVSVAATRGAYEGQYLGGLMNELQATMPHIVHLLNDQKLDADTLAEMMELKPGGKVGVTGNRDAMGLAKTFAKFAELARLDHNRLGGMMGKLLGWNGVQMHDDFKMVSGGPGAKERWIGYIATKLDMARTFPDGLTDAEVHDALGSMFDTIITGTPATPTATEMGKRVGPAGLAKQLSASRVLHFKDAESSLAYREQYGYGNTIGGMLMHLKRMAHVNANMDVLGPNPEVMFGAAAGELKRRIRDATEVPDGTRYGPLWKRYTPTLEQWKEHESEAINTQAGALRDALDIATGLASRPVNTTLASIGGTIRLSQGMAKLGAALPTSFADLPTVALEGMFRGSGFVETLSHQVQNLMNSQTQEAKELGYLYGEGFDGLIGHVLSGMQGYDRVPGLASHLSEKFFRWNGLTGWTDIGRAGSARIIGAEMGMRSGTAHAALPPQYRHALEMNGIDATRWDIMRQGALRSSNGRAYLTPDRIAQLPDAAFMPLVGDRINAARVASRVDEAKSQAVRDARQTDFERRRAGILQDGRMDVTIAMRRFIADETSYGVIETDARSQRMTTWGMRPGTPGGEAIRFLMQFKGFPLAYSQRVLGRAIYGMRPDASTGERAMHIGALIAGLTVAGYVSMTVKDALKGYTPRNPLSDKTGINFQTMMAALQQGGAVGIYGDYLFGSTNRFGGTLLETLAGPSIGSASQLADIAFDLRDAAVSGGDNKFSFSRAFSTLTSQVPFANLHVVKPALDYLILNSVREMLSPGYMRNQDQNREKQYGQQVIDPGLGPRSLDPLNKARAF